MSGRLWYYLGMVNNVPFTDIDAKYGFPAGTLASVWQQETHCGQNNHTSSAGCKGHFQFGQQTRDGVLHQSGYDAFSSDPKQAAQAAGFLLNTLRNQFGGNLSIALAAYNSNPTHVKEALAHAKATGRNWLEFMHQETRDYVPAVLGRIGQKMDYTISNVNLDMAARNAYAARGHHTRDEEDVELSTRIGGLEGNGMSEDDVNKLNRQDILGGAFFKLIMGFFAALIGAANGQNPSASSPVAPTAPTDGIQSTGPTTKPVTPPVPRSTPALVSLPAH